MQDAYDLVIIGGGTVALSALMEALALDRGIQSVALIEKRRELGGECALNAYVPTKTLLTAARLKRYLTDLAPQYGFENIRYDFNFRRLMQKEAEVINEGSDAMMEDPRVTRIHGEAAFIDAQTVQVGERRIRGEKFLIATGSEPEAPDNIEGLADTGYITFQEATHLERLPESLMIIGGGPVGVEFATLFHELGVKVCLLEHGEQLMQHEDPEISAMLKADLERRGMNIFLGCDFRSVSRENGRKAVTLYCGQEKKVFVADELLVAIGMKPRYAALRLENAGVELNEKGIIVDDTLRTSVPHIFAAGDVIGRYPFTHTGDYEGVIAARNAINNGQEKTNYWGFGWAIHTLPTIAHVQYTEAEAREHYRNVVVLSETAENVSRNRIESERTGMVKLIVDADTDRLVGGHMMGPGADDVMHVVMLAVRRNLTVAEVADLIYLYPSRTQIVQKALEKYPQAKAAAMRVSVR